MTQYIKDLLRSCILTCVNVVRCRRLAGVGQLEEGAWCTDIPPPASPSVFSFLKAPSEA